MRKAEIAEWILCRLTNSDRAASIVGDLIEQQRGTAWFWRAIVMVAGSLAWRPAIAFVVSFYTGMCTMGVFDMAVYGIHVKHVPDVFPWEPIFFCTTLIGSALWTASMYALIRHGLRDDATQLALIWTGLITAFQYFWWQPVVLIACIGAAMFTVATSVLQEKRRKVALVVFFTIAVASATRVAAYGLCILYRQFIRIRPSGDHAYHDHLSLAWVLFSSLILSFYAATFVWSKMHAWQLRCSRRESAICD